MAHLKTIAVPCCKLNCPGSVLFKAELLKRGERNILIIKKTKARGNCKVCGGAVSIEYILPNAKNWEVSLRG